MIRGSYQILETGDLVHVRYNSIPLCSFSITSYADILYVVMPKFLYEQGYTNRYNFPFNGLISIYDLRIL